MNIIHENVDGLNAQLKVSVDKADYQDKVEQMLKDYRKKAAIKGFRPGKAPEGLISKLYRLPITAEEVNKLVSESISNYLFEQKLNILGEPMPSENQPKIDWETQENFEFVFDMGLVPEFELKLAKRDKVPYYTIAIDDKIRELYLDSHQRRHGTYVPVEVAGDNDLLKVTLTELNSDESPRDGGINVDSASVAIGLVGDEAEKAKLMGAKIGDVFVIDVTKAFPNETDRAALLRVNKANLGSVEPLFQATVTETMTYEKGELNQELFDKVYGEGAVASQEEFIAKVEEEIKANLQRESDFRFLVDLKDKLVDKAKFDLPKEFLVRWLVAINEGKVTREQVETEYPMFEKDLKWQLIRDKISKEQELVVDDAALTEFAQTYAREQFAAYGLREIPEEYLVRYAEDILKKDDERRKIRERLLEDKVVAWVKEAVKLDEKEVSADDFNKL